MNFQSFSNRESVHPRPLRESQLYLRMLKEPRQQVKSFSHREPSHSETVQKWLPPLLRTSRHYLQPISFKHPTKSKEEVEHEERIKALAVFVARQNRVHWPIESKTNNPQNTPQQKRPENSTPSLPPLPLASISTTSAEKTVPTEQKESTLSPPQDTQRKFSVMAVIASSRPTPR